MTSYRDPRGPLQTITAVTPDPNGGLTNVALDCGHIVKLNQIYSYGVGDRCRCFTCATEGK